MTQGSQSGVHGPCSRDGAARGQRGRLFAWVSVVLVGLAGGWAAIGSASAAGPGSCPIHLQIVLDKSRFTSWEIAAGRILVSNRVAKAVPSRIVVGVFHQGIQVSRRDLAFDILPGRQTYDIATALGYPPLISPGESFLGDWRLAVEARTQECSEFAEAFFTVDSPPARRTPAWKGLVGYWPFDDGQGRVAADWSGVGQDARLSEALWIDEAAHRVLAFNGRSSAVRIPGVRAPGRRGMTVSFWIWPDGAEGRPQIVLSRFERTKRSRGAGWIVLLDGGRLVLQIVGSRGLSRTPLSPPAEILPRKFWSHVVLTQDGGVLRLYVDGRRTATTSVRLPGGVGSDLFLGASPDSGMVVAGLAGRLRGLRIFDRPLDQAEIEAEPGLAMPAAVQIVVDPTVWIKDISPLIYGANVEGNDPFSLRPGGGINLIRWPGGCFAEGYHWRNAVGPIRERRVRGAAVCEGEQMSSPPVRADVGPDEFMTVIRGAGAIPLLTVNFSTGTAQEAANWVEYMNGESPGLAGGIRRGWTPDAYRGSDKAPSGYFAWLRERFGHARPYGVKYWAVGNEFEVRSTPSWTRDARRYYSGGMGKVASLMTRDSTRTDWSLEQRISTGQPSAEFYTPFTPVVPDSQRVEVLPVVRREPLELGPAQVWRPDPRIAAAGSTNAYQLLPAEGKIVFGDGIGGNVLPKGMVVRISYTSGPHDGFLEFARKMKAVDSSILVGSSAATSEIPAEAAGSVDFIAANHYPLQPRNDPDPRRRYYRIQAAAVAEFEPYIRRTQAYVARSYPTRKIQLALTEYNVNLDSPHLRSLASALFVADMLRVFAVHGVSMANYYSLDFLHSSRQEGERDSAPGLVFGLYHSHFGSRLVATQATGTPLAEEDFDGRTVRFPLLEVLASLSDTGQSVFLLALNKDADRPLALAIRAVGRNGVVTGRLFQLWGEHPFDEGVAFHDKNLQGSAGVVRVIVPPHSISVVEIGPDG